jgi:hypothetical protein
MDQVREGGCQCGAVRYQLEGEPVALVVCHCTECQRQSGSAFGMSLFVLRKSLRLLSGELKKFTREGESGNIVGCMFCGDCGTRIYHESEMLGEGTVNIKPGTLDDTSWLSPSLQVWTRSKQPWVPLAEGVRAMERQP